MITTSIKTETREVIIYTTSDGREFRSSEFAEAHEKELTSETRYINFTFTGEIRCFVKVPRDVSPAESDAYVREYFTKNIYSELYDATNISCTGFTDIAKA